ncbi:MAG: sugar phosphate isomerase/epimerase family protein [Pirellulales bacterium]
MMIRSAVTVSLVSQARGGPFVFWDDLPRAAAKAAELGYDAIEIFAPSAEALDSGTIGGLLREHDLALAAVGTGAGMVIHKLSLTDPDDGQRAKAKAFVKQIIDAGAPFGAPAIIGSMQGRHGDGVDQPTALRWLAEALDELGEHAAQYNVPLIYEPLNRYETNLVNTIAAGVELLQSLAGGNVKLLADLFHMNIEEQNIADALRQGGRWIGHVHFVDSNRRPAGDGHTDFAPIAAALREIEFNGYASAEAFPYPDSATAAETTIAAYRKWFQEK